MQRESPHGIRRLLFGERRLRAFALANVLWEFSFAGLRAFIVLYLVRGLGESTAVASAAIAVVAIAYVVGAPIAGWLADRFGIVRVVRLATLVYGVGLVAGVLPKTLTPMLIGLPFVAVAGALLMSLSGALVFSIVPSGNEGAAAGVQDFSRGLGVVLGPIVVGVVVEEFSSVLSSTNGYAAMWPVVGIPVLASFFLTAAFKRPQRGAGSEDEVATRRD